MMTHILSGTRTDPIGRGLDAQRRRHSRSCCSLPKPSCGLLVHAVRQNDPTITTSVTMMSRFVQSIFTASLTLTNIRLSAGRGQYI
jgi:hypothetical protein